MPPEWIGEDGPLLARHLDRLIDRGVRLRNSVNETLASLRGENTRPC